MTAIVYWSGTGNTEAMAKAIESGLKENGEDTVLFSVDKVNADIIEKHEKFAFGCPSMGAEALEESEFEPFFASIEGKLSGKKVALFGSYGWGDGEWMRNWQDQVKGDGAAMFDDGLIQQEAPNESVCKEFGIRFAEF